MGGLILVPAITGTQAHEFIFIFLFDLILISKTGQPSDWSKQLFTDPRGNTGGPQSCLHVSWVGGGSFPGKKKCLNTNSVQDICGESTNPAV